MVNNLDSIVSSSRVIHKEPVERKENGDGESGEEEEQEVESGREVGKTG